MHHGMVKPLVHIWDKEAARKLAQNERQRRCKQRQREVVHNALAIVVESIQENNNVNLERLNTRCVNFFAMEWFHQTSHRGLEFQQILLPKILKNPIWRGILPDFSELENIMHKA